MAFTHVDPYTDQDRVLFSAQASVVPATHGRATALSGDASWDRWVDGHDLLGLREACSTLRPDKAPSRLLSDATVAGLAKHRRIWEDFCRYVGLDLLPLYTYVDPT